MNSSIPFRAAADAAAARWVVDGLQGFAESVASITPAGFAAYARVYHPAWRTIGDTRTILRWAEVARRTGRAAHRQMQWPSILGSYEIHTSPSPLYPQDRSFEAPHEGTLPPDLARVLWPTLAPHTSTPEACWFAVWEGFGCLRPDVQSAPAFEIPNRRMHLFRAPIAAIEASFCDPPVDQSANLWWPDDRAWCVATEIDFMTTYIGGARATIAALLACADAEADAVELSDGVSWASDAVNPAPAGSPY
jgi:hypothetical protein